MAEYVDEEHVDREHEQSSEDTVGDLCRDLVGVLAKEKGIGTEGAGDEAEEDGQAAGAGEGVVGAHVVQAEDGVLILELVDETVPDLLKEVGLLPHGVLQGPLSTFHCPNNLLLRGQYAQVALMVRLILPLLLIRRRYPVCHDQLLLPCKSLLSIRQKGVIHGNEIGGIDKAHNIERQAVAEGKSAEQRCIAYGIHDVDVRFEVIGIYGKVREMEGEALGEVRSHLGYH
mmetsp:Transcript_39853/g.64616  ORF Transcript_39853/g.64616 Transcript_39853/m.64616 type:complete len:229 (-) Transcript_39853:2007-2693(-)